MIYPPFIILEGPDASGKSTLAHHICHRIDAVVLHGASIGDDPARPDNESIMRRYHTNLVDIARRNLALGHPIVCDRLWMSHVIYGQMRNPEGSYAEYAQDFHRMCDALGAYYIFCLDDACIENHKKHLDADHPYKEEQIKTLLGLYRRLHLQYREQYSKNVSQYAYTREGKNVPEYLERLQSHHGLLMR